MYLVPLTSGPCIGYSHFLGHRGMVKGQQKGTSAFKHWSVEVLMRL